MNYANSRHKQPLDNLTQLFAFLRCRLIISVVILFVSLQAKSQCELFDGQGNMNANPQWVSCNGGAFTLFIQSNTTFGAYTIDWGDGSPISSGASLVPPAFVSHTYAAAVATYTVTFTETSSGCVVTGTVVMEEPVNASIQIPVGGVTQICAPGTLEFINSSTDVSPNTIFTWDFGDGSPIQTFGDTNAGQIIAHTYQQNTVNCVTQVTLTAENACSFGNPTVASFNPIQIYDIDDAAITASQELLCYPDTVVHFDNTTNRNCVPQGNTVQRFEYWNFGDYWGLGYDSIINWQPFLPPNRPGYDIAYPGIGSYDVMLIDSNQCGLDTAYITIDIVPQPTAGMTVNKDTACTGEQFTFTNTSTGGSNQHRINFGDGTGWQNINVQRNKSYTSAGTYTVQLVANIVGGSVSCTDTTSLVVEVLPSPNVSFNLAPNSSCDSITVNFTNNSTGGSIYFWDFDNGDTSTLQNPGPVDFNTPGPYDVELTVTSNNGCFSSATQSVDVYASPIAGFNAQNVCEDELGTFLDATVTGYGGGVVSWLWNFGDPGNSTSTLQNPTFTYQDSGDYIFSLAVATANCTDTLSDTITVEARPVADFTMSDSAGCSPLSVSFSDVSTGAVNYFWDFGDGSTSTLQNPTHTFVHTGLSDTTYIIGFYASSAFGCTDSVFDTVLVQGNPTAQFTSNALPGCAPLEVQFTNNSIGTGTLNWDFGDGSGSTVSNPTHSFQNTSLFITNYTVSLTLTAANGCADTATETITVYPEPLFNFNSIPDSGCSPLHVQFPVAVGAVIYQWDFGDGTTANGPSPSHTFVNNTTNDQIFTVTLIATSAFGCQDTVTGDVLVHPNPVANISLDTNKGCQPLDITFQNNSVGGSFFNWDFGDGNTSTSALATLNHTYTNLTSDTLFFDPTLIVTTDKGCADTASANVEVYRFIEANFTGPADVCESLDTVFLNGSTNAAVNFWDFDDGTTSNLVDPTHAFSNPSLNTQTYDLKLVVTSVEGCQDSITQSIAVFPKPIAGFVVSDTQGCEPLVLTITNNSQLNQINAWDFGDGNTSANAANSFNYTYPNPTNVPIQRGLELAIENQFGCVDTMAKTITVFSQIIADFFGPMQGCHPFDTSLTNLSTNAISYDWDFDDGTSSIQSNPSHTFSNNGLSLQNFNVELVATNSEGCADSIVQTVIVFPKPTADFVVSDTQGCEPLILTITNNSLLNQINAWDFGDGNTSANAANSFNYTYPNPSNTPVQRELELAIENQFGCVDTMAKTITVFSQIIADFFGPMEGCHPFDTTMTNLSTNAVNYDWDFDDGTLTNAMNPSHTFQNGGTSNQVFDVELIAENAEGCTDVITKPVTVFPKPSASFQVSTNLGCGPLEVTFTNNSILNDSNSWIFSTGQQLSSNANAVIHTFENPTNNAAIYNPELIVVTNNGCSDTAATQVEVHPQIIAGFVFDSVGCHPHPVQFQDTSVNAAQYEYNFGDGSPNANFSNPSHIYSNNGTTTQNLTAQQIVTNAEGCEDTATIAVTIFPKPDADFNVTDNPACFGEPVVISNQSTLNAENIWKFSSNGFPVIDNNPQIDTFFFNFTPNPRNFPITLVVESNDGCRDTIEKTMTVYPEVEAKFTMPDEGCTPFEVTFTNQSTGGQLYSWDFGDGNQAFIEQPTHTFENPDTTDIIYDVILTVTSQYNCENRDTLPVLVRPTPAVFFSATPVSQQFPSATVTLDNQTNTGPWAFNWTFGDGENTTVIEPDSHLYDTWGEYTITLRANTAFCSDTHSQTIVIEPPLPVANFLLDEDGCAPVIIEFENLSEYGVEFVWDFGDGGSSSAENPVYTYSAPGEYTVRLTVTGPGGETSIHTQPNSVNVYEQPTANFTYTPSQVTIPTQPVTFINYSVSADNYQWFFDDGETSTDEDPQHFYRESGEYFPLLVASTEFGCVDTMLANVPIEAVEVGLIEVPNAFTPSETGGNGGGFDPLATDNQVFFPIVSGVKEENYLLTIYNRWGELIFESDDLRLGWDGYYRGKVCQQDVYVWKMQGEFVNGRKFTKVGDVTLLR